MKEKITKVIVIYGSTTENTETLAEGVVLDSREAIQKLQ